MALVQVDHIKPHEPQAYLLVKSVYTSQDPKEVGGTLVGSQPVVNEVIPSYPTYGQHHSSLREDNHRNDDLTYFSISKNLVWGTILQGYSLRNTILGLDTFHSGRGVY